MTNTTIAAALAEPPLRGNAAGRLRTVGVEVEFGALRARRAAAALGRELDGSVVEEDAHALMVRGTALGDLMVEIGTHYAHPQRHRRTRWGRLGRDWAARLATLSQPPVPRAPVTAPAPLDRLALVDWAVDVLRRPGAAAEREDWKARGAAPSPPHGAGERGGLERRAGLEPVGGRRAPGGGAAAVRAPGRRLSFGPKGPGGGPRSRHARRSERGGAAANLLGKRRPPFSVPVSSPGARA